MRVAGVTAGGTGRNRSIWRPTGKKIRAAYTKMLLAAASRMGREGGAAAGGGRPARRRQTSTRQSAAADAPARRRITPRLPGAGGAPFPSRDGAERAPVRRSNRGAANADSFDIAASAVQSPTAQAVAASPAPEGAGRASRRARRMQPRRTKRAASRSVRPEMYAAAFVWSGWQAKRIAAGNAAGRVRGMRRNRRRTSAALSACSHTFVR